MFKSRILAFGLLAAFVALSIAAPANSASPVEGNFGSGGKVFTNFGFTAVKVDADVRTFPLADGKTLVFQPYGDSGLKAAKVYRLNLDGALDPTFGKGGVLLGDLGAGFNLLPGGKFVISGQVDGGENGSDVALRRYRADGTPDSGFGKNGLTRYDLGKADYVQTVTVLSDGKLLVQAIADCWNYDSCDPESPTDDYLSLINRSGNVIRKSKPLEGRFGEPVETPDGKMRALGRTGTDFFGSDVDEELISINPNLTVSSIRNFGKNELASTDLVINPDGSMILLRGFNPTSVTKLTPAGDDDTGFGTGGKVTCTEPPPTGYSVGNGKPPLQLDHQNRIIVRGAGCDLFRLLPNGDIDTAFGTGGSAETDAISMLGAGAKVTRDDGLILSSWDYQRSTIVLKKLGSDGLPDPSFGGPDGIEILATSAHQDVANSISTLRNGKLMVGGVSRCPGFQVSPDSKCSGLLLARYGKNGRLDSGFGQGGKVQETGPTLNINVIRTGRTGNVIAAGRGVKDAVADPREEAPPIWFMTKYLPGGKLDTSFGDGGRVFTDPSEFGSDSSEGSYISAIDFQRNGRIVATGYARDCGGAQFCLPVARYLKDGRLDKSFADDGIFRLAGGAIFGRSIAVQKDGRILVGATIDVKRLVVLRLLPNGKLDPTWGDGGIARPKIKLAARVKIRKNGNVPAHEASGMILLGNGSVLVSGAQDHAWRQGVILKLRSDGSLDRSFGDRGVSYLGGFQPSAIVRDQCGRVDVAGRYPSGVFGESGHAGLRSLSRSGKVLRGQLPRLPFGKDQTSDLTSITATGGKGIVAAGWKDRVSTGKDVALVRLRAPGCR